MKEQLSYHWGTGRRKRAVARVRIRPGTGKIVINRRPYTEYFRLAKDIDVIMAPLKAAKCQRTYDVWASIQGGGISGQAGALVMGLGRALLAADPEVEHTLREGKFLTRDARMTERKKYGRKKARKSFQFSKR
ncbi:MAG: 30S ribosomal protein S9 [Planctomycetota bacterium]